ncbi:MAG: DUF302 domain-containing protein [Acidimicrobiia bacterium]
MTTHRYGFGIETQLSLDEAEARMRSALADEGFGILTEIDVAATLKNKLDVSVPPYRILGACNPQLAHEALKAEQSIGLLLPCNVIIYETDDGSVIEVLEPNLMAELTSNNDLGELAKNARSRLERALATVAG